MNFEYLFNNNLYNNNNNLYNNHSKISIETSISPSINTLSPISDEFSISSMSGGKGLREKLADMRTRRAEKQAENKAKKDAKKAIDAMVKEAEADEAAAKAAAAAAAAKAAAAKEAAAAAGKNSAMVKVKEAYNAKNKLARGKAAVKKLLNKGNLMQKAIVCLSLVILLLGGIGLGKMGDSNKTAAISLFVLGIIGEIIFIWMLKQHEGDSLKNVYIAGGIAKLFQFISFCLIAADGESATTGLGVTTIVFVLIQLCLFFAIQNPVMAGKMKDEMGKKMTELKGRMKNKLKLKGKKNFKSLFGKKK